MVDSEMSDDETVSVDSEKVKDEPVFCNDEENTLEEGYSEGHFQMPLKKICLTSEHEERIEQGEVQETISVGVGEINSVIVEIKHESDDDDDITIEELSIEEQIELRRKSLSRKPEHKKQTELAKVQETISLGVSELNSEIVEIKHESDDEDNITIEELSIEEQIELSRKSLSRKPEHKKQTELAKAIYATHPLIRVPEHLEEHTDITSTSHTEAGETTNNDDSSSLANLYICYDCNNSFNDKDLLIKHLAKHSNLTFKFTFKCDVCMKMFNSKSNFEIHYRIHTGDKPYKCDVCMESFRYNRALKSHYIIHTGNKPYKCDICNQGFVSNRNLREHCKIKHGGETPFKCDVCMKYFNNQSYLSVHMRIHSGEKPFECEVCKKRFRYKKNLTTHNRTLACQKPYKCDVCMKGFKLKTVLDKHCRIHTEKPYKCEICKECFRSKKSLDVHHANHSVDRPFKCDVCNKGFLIQSHLTRHNNIHTGENPYQCTVCHKSFDHKNNLSKHFRIHTGEKPFKCDKCEKAFTQKISLIGHVCKSK